MTDAALPVTERAVERITEAYLASLGAEIEKDGRRWTVRIPDDADTELQLNDAILEIASDPTAVDDGALAVAPGSEFVDRLLEEAADRAPVGSIELTAEEFGIQLPPWITQGSLEITKQSFTPYYDREAICLLFEVGIETVSEYQTEELHAVAMDCTDHDARPRLAETYLELSDDDWETISAGEPPDPQTIKSALDPARSFLEDELQPKINDIRKQATRAAEVELSEYREFVEQRRDELAKEIENVESRIQDVSESVDQATDQEERVTALQQRKQLRAERESLEGELAELTDEIDSGFNEKREDIRERHALKIRIRPVIATAVSYERGDLELAIADSDRTAELTYSYAVGTGVLDTPNCTQCGESLSDANPLTIEGGRQIGVSCCGGDYV